MCEINENLAKLWKRKISIFAILLLLLLLAATIAEIYGVINIIKNSETPPYNIDTVAQLIGAIGSILLTIGLVVLYDKQASISKQQTAIQDNQEQLMQAEYEPKLKSSIGFKERQSIQFEIHNSGKAAAHDVQLMWEYGDQKYSWTKSVIRSGEMTGFSLLDENDNYLLHPDEVKEFFNEIDGPTISYKIECRDILDNSHEFEGIINVVEIIESRTDPVEFSNPSGISDELSNIDSTLQKIQREMKTSPIEQMEKRRSSFPKESTEKSDDNGDNQTE